VHGGRIQRSDLSRLRSQTDLHWNLSDRGCAAV